MNQHLKRICIKSFICVGGFSGPHLGSIPIRLEDLGRVHCHQLSNPMEAFDSGVDLTKHNVAFRDVLLWQVKHFDVSHLPYHITL